MTQIQVSNRKILLIIFFRILKLWELIMIK